MDEGEAPAIAAAREFRRSNRPNGLGSRPPRDDLHQFGAGYPIPPIADFAEASALSHRGRRRSRDRARLGREALERAIADETFCHFLHVGVYALAQMRKFI